jgi:RNA polymerase sigma-70 factor (ECF subfamily)
MDKQQDIDFWAALKSGDREAHHKVFEQHKDVVFGYALKILDRKEDAQDVVQKVFSAFWEKREEINITSSVKNYLISAARYKAVDILRQRKKENNYEKDQLYILPVEQLPNNDIDKKEFRKSLHEALKKMPSKNDRDAFILVHIEGHNYKDAAEKMGISVNVIRVYVSRACQFLKPFFKNYLLILL